MTPLAATTSSLTVTSGRMPASSLASSALSTASLTQVRSALRGLSKPSRWRFLVKNSETEISRCLAPISAAVTCCRGLAAVFWGATESGADAEEAAEAVCDADNLLLLIHPLNAMRDHLVSYFPATDNAPLKAPISSHGHGSDDGPDTFRAASGQGEGHRRCTGLLELLGETGGDERLLQTVGCMSMEEVDAQHRVMQGTAAWSIDTEDLGPAG